jgi:3-oxoacyl-(acyl-carrier-protein) synthase
MDVIERAFYSARDDGNRMAPTTAAASIPQAPAITIADGVGVRAHAATVSSACTSGLDAVATATAMIRLGEAELAIAGGTDAPITPLVMGSFIAAGLVCNGNGDPQRASRPFDSLRESGVLSEGAGVFVIENLERARARGAHIYLELTGYGKRRDLDPAKPVSALADSMKLAIANAHTKVDEVDYISAYGPGDPVLDAAEVAMIKEVFGSRAYSIPISSIKGVTGNALAAGGPFQIASCALSIRDQIVAPTANYEVADQKCDLDFVPNYPRKMKLDCALINVRGLGGSASTLIVNRVPS